MTRGCKVCNRLALLMCRCFIAIPGTDSAQGFQLLPCCALTINQFLTNVLTSCAASKAAVAISVESHRVPVMTKRRRLIRPHPDCNRSHIMLTRYSEGITLTQVVMANAHLICKLIVLSRLGVVTWAGNRHGSPPCSNLRMMPATEKA